MASINVLQRAESGQWLLARDLDDVRLDELYEAAQLRIPAVDVPVPQPDDALGVAVRDTIAQLRTPLQQPLRQPVSSVYAGIPEE
jgi:membrane protein